MANYLEEALQTNKQPKTAQMKPCGRMLRCWSACQLGVPRGVACQVQQRAAYASRTAPRVRMRVSSAVLEDSERNRRIQEDPQRFYPSVAQLAADGKLQAPGIASIASFLARYSALDTQEHEQEQGKEQELAPEQLFTRRVSLAGRISSIRSSGKKIWFLDIAETCGRDNGTTQGQQQLQVIVNFNEMATGTGPLTSLPQFLEQLSSLKKNDYVLCSGVAGRSKNKQKTLSLVADTPPLLLAPIQTPLPSSLSDSAKVNNNKVINYQVNGIGPLLLRAQVLQLVRGFFTADRRAFIEVETPILSAKSNGANAKPFVIHNKDKVDRPSESHTAVELRVAPELWLKRLIISGMDRIFEIGKVFRNESVDHSHNPEFTILEAYQRYATMEDLIEMAEELLKYVLLRLPQSATTQYMDKSIINPQLSALTESLRATDWKFRRVEFIPTLSREMGVDMSQVNMDNRAELVATLPSDFISDCLDNDVEQYSTPQIINKLCSYYIEARHCMTLHPTLIYHHPLAISPLSKANATVNGNGSTVTTRRFEVFIQGREYINAYEEENSPNVQLANFTRQQEQRCEAKARDGARDGSTDGHPMAVDGGYIEAMRSGMPPTGGFGMGIDRLCMLLMGTSRIEDVLPFGTLDDVNRQ